MNARDTIKKLVTEHKLDFEERWDPGEGPGVKMPIEVI